MVSGGTRQTDNKFSIIWHILANDIICLYMLSNKVSKASVHGCLGTLLLSMYKQIMSLKCAKLLRICCLSEFVRTYMYMIRLCIALMFIYIVPSH